MNNSIKKVPCTAATVAENINVTQQNNTTESDNCQILPCPRCGSPAILKPTGVYGDKAYRVMCSRCHVSTTPICYDTVGGYCELLPDGGFTFTKHYTEDEAKQKVINTWNRRVTA